MEEPEVTAVQTDDVEIAQARAGAMEAAEATAAAAETPMMEMFSPDDWRVLQAAVEVAVRNRMLLRLFCLEKQCVDAGADTMLVNLVDTEHGRVLKCGHKERSLLVIDRLKADRIMNAMDRRVRRNAKRLK
jgi:hypothetical protein